MKILLVILAGLFLAGCGLRYVAPGDICLEPGQTIALNSDGEMIN